MGVGLFGKVPARGDFVTGGLPADVVDPWDRLLAAMTLAAEAGLGPAWTAAWDAAPAWGFWIGAHVPLGPAAGVIRPSRDRVGRRYPMLLLAKPETGHPLPPVISDPDSAAWYAALTEATETLSATDLRERPADIVGELPPVPDLAPAGDTAFSAEGQGGLSALIADVAGHDHGLAALTRSYWWSEAPNGQTAFFALDGLPDPAIAAALLQIVPLPSAEPEPDEAVPSLSPARSEPSYNDADASPFGRPPRLKAETPIDPDAPAPHSQESLKH